MVGGEILATAIVGFLLIPFALFAAVYATVTRRYRRGLIAGLFGLACALASAAMSWPITSWVLSGCCTRGGDAFTRDDMTGIAVIVGAQALAGLASFANALRHGARWHAAPQRPEPVVRR